MFGIFQLLVPALLAVSVQSAAITSRACQSEGSFPLIDNPDEYYICRRDGYGGYTLQYLSCQPGDVFSAQMEECIAEALLLRDGGDIENPTIPTKPSSPNPDNNEDSSTAMSDTTKNDGSTGTTPGGSVITEDGGSTATTPGGSVITEDGGSTTTTPGGSVITEDGGSTATTPGGSVITEDGGSTATTPGGSVITEDGGSTATTPGGSVITEDGGSTATTPGGSVITEDGGSTATADGTKTTLNASQICATTGSLPMDDSCTEYYMCYRDEGEMRVTILSCPPGMEFNDVFDYCELSTACSEASA